MNSTKGNQDTLAVGRISRCLPGKQHVSTLYTHFHRLNTRQIINLKKKLSKCLTIIFKFHELNSKCKGKCSVKSLGWGVKNSQWKLHFINHTVGVFIAKYYFLLQ